MDSEAEATIARVYYKFQNKRRIKPKIKPKLIPYKKEPKLVEVKVIYQGDYNPFNLPESDLYDYDSLYDEMQREFMKDSNTLECGCYDYSDRGFSNGCRCIVH